MSYIYIATYLLIHKISRYSVCSYYSYNFGVARNINDILKCIRNCTVIFTYSVFCLHPHCTEMLNPS
jgi:hypothetical protein